MKKSETVKTRKKAGSAPRAKLAALASKLASGSAPAPSVPARAVQRSAPAPAPAAPAVNSGEKDSGRSYQSYSLTKERQDTLDDRQRELALLAVENGDRPSTVTRSGVLRLALVRLSSKMPGEIGKIAEWLATNPPTEKTGGSKKGTAFYLTKIVSDAVSNIEKAALMRGISLSQSGLTFTRMMEYALKEPFTKADYARLKEVET